MGGRLRLSIWKGGITQDDGAEPTGIVETIQPRSASSFEDPGGSNHLALDRCQRLQITVGYVGMLLENSRSEASPDAERSLVARSHVGVLTPHHFSNSIHWLPAIPRDLNPMIQIARNCGRLSRAIRRQTPSYLTMGRINLRRCPGFSLGPYLADRKLHQRPGNVQAQTRPCKP